VLAYINTDTEQGLTDAVQAVSEAISQLIASTEVAACQPGIDQDFTDAAILITENAGRVSKGKSS
jgi:hypothetical protein